ncbi:CopG family ribbon-helix-helix protein [Tropicimonas sp. IMCC6043]|uniref:CopG family ribbon-helix-helix protein n=1 Tax=Tropicimonas sp. IMCC6043 TaxID=2510645 RepID=UPI00101CEC98|nr:ribbon-helix-helix protein, CopG family [Tropicimonas sp. IMCC6043]RYH07765.1 ribbon-helix-helix protein, CopG family [Tropicimonas sp. IMCC6043]
MPRPKGKKDTVRFTVSLDPQLHAKLLRIAESNDLSLSWAVRRAVAEFIERQDASHQAELPFSQPASKE